jgi:hypothetical protein
MCSGTGALSSFQNRSLRCRLKIGKANASTRVLLNGKLLGAHAPFFTPGCFDAGIARNSIFNVVIVYFIEYN